MAWEGLRVMRASELWKEEYVYGLVLGAVGRGLEESFAFYLSARVLERAREGRSMDSDELRALVLAARGGEVLP